MTARRGGSFLFAERELDVASGAAVFRYELDSDGFEEVVHVPGGGTVEDPAALDLLLDLCHVAMGTSYFKVSAPERLRFKRPTAPAVIELARSLYDDGLREFAVTNGLGVPLTTDIDAVADHPLPALVPRGERALIPIGGGKDSAAMLGIVPQATALAVGATEAHERLAAAAGVDLVRVERTLDPLLAQRTATGMNGHIPVTAINSSLSVLVAALHGYDFVVMGNERSASEPTVVVDGVPVNHQWSKSFACEALLHNTVAPSGVSYFSLLRQCSELTIAGIVAHNESLRPHFLSCNRAFKLSRERGQPQMWCLDCPKCFFTFLCFAPFVTPAAAAHIFGGDPLADAANGDRFADLWRAKPFDCVGERGESAFAMAWLAELDGWKRHAVVEELAAEAASIADGLGVTRDAVLTTHGPHLVPPRLHARVTAAVAQLRP
jgi:UDP-N-acetyl-alpha-D-muramoyl-L-alanyl-L-glutamate epimerase